MIRGKVVITLFLPAMVLVFLAMTMGIEASVEIKDVPRMSKDELKAQLNNPDIVVIDARSGKDWKASEFKIKGAKRENPENVSWAGKYQKGKTMVFYCA